MAENETADRVLVIDTKAMYEFWRREGKFVINKYAEAISLASRGIVALIIIDLYPITGDELSNLIATARQARPFCYLIAYEDWVIEGPIQPDVRFDDFDQLHGLLANLNNTVAQRKQSARLEWEEKFLGQSSPVPTSLELLQQLFGELDRGATIYEINPEIIAVIKRQIVFNSLALQAELDAQARQADFVRSLLRLYQDLGGDLRELQRSFRDFALDHVFGDLLGTEFSEPEGLAT